MKKFFSLVWFLFCLQSAFAQEQITDFENVAIKSPQNIQFIDTLNGKIVFFVNQPEQRQQQSLWSSDGTAASTKILKDEFGESASAFYGENFKIKNYRYLKGQHIWRTDGQKLERIISNSDSLSSLQKFNNKPLLMFRKSETIGNQGFYFFTFTWLDSLNKVNIFDRDIVYYQIIDSTLHYIKLNKQTKFFELHNLSCGKHYKSIIPISQTVFNIYSFEIFTQKDVDFYFLNTNQGKKFFSKKTNDSADVSFLSLIDWGSNQYNFPWVLKDEFKKTYFANYNSSINNLKIYALTEQNTLVEQWSIQTLLFFPDNNLYYGQGFQIRNMSIIGEKLVFSSTTGSEGINAYYFNVFDIKKNTNRKSRNFGGGFGNMFYNINVTQKDSNTYELDNKIGSIATYNFLADSVTNIRTYSYRNSYSSDSIFIVNQQKILLSDNIYNITDGSKKELIPSRQVFDSYSQNNFYAKALGDKLLFWQYNPKLQKTQLWASNGEKKGSELLLTLDVYFYAHIDMYQKQIVEINDKLYFYSNDYNANKSFFYETDGTKAGTHKIFETLYAEFVKSNTKQIIFRTNEKQIVVIENGKGYLIKDIPVTNYFDIYQTATQTYIHSDSYEIFRIVDGRSILVDSDVSNWLVVYKNQIFYSKIGQLKTIDESGKITEIAKNIFEFGVYGNKLIYKQPIADDKPPKITILDIPTNKIDLTIDNFYGIGFIPIRDAIIITSQSKSLIIKGSQRKDYNDIPTQYEFIPFSKGFITKKNINPYDNNLSIFDYSYFDLETNQLYPITKANGVFYEQGKNLEYLLFYDNLNDSTNTWRYWTSKNKQMIELSNNQNLLGIDVKQVVSINIRNRKYTYWSFDGNTLTKRYEFENNNSNLVKSDSTFYWLKSTNTTGNELIQLGAESIITYPEIVKGSEGISLGNVFHFNNQLYVYAFTYSYGWQVWKMSEGDKGTPLSKEEENESFINVFPNPVQDFLSIDSQQKYRYRVINNKGQEMMKGNIEPQQTINFKNLATGLYIIQFSDGVKTFSKKVIKY